jgi:hypothetical protein
MLIPWERCTAVFPETWIGLVSHSALGQPVVACGHVPIPLLMVSAGVFCDTSHIY